MTTTVQPLISVLATIANQYSLVQKYEPISEYNSKIRGIICHHYAELFPKKYKLSPEDYFNRESQFKAYLNKCHEKMTQSQIKELSLFLDSTHECLKSMHCNSLIQFICEEYEMHNGIFKNPKGIITKKRRQDAIVTVDKMKACLEYKTTYENPKKYSRLEQAFKQGFENGYLLNLPKNFDQEIKLVIVAVISTNGYQLYRRNMNCLTNQFLNISCKAA